jgi:hypothetical protein
MDFSGAIDLSAKGNEKEPMLRLLVCRNCKTIEELPDYDGDPEMDTLLQVLISKHQKPDAHIGVVIKCPVRFWIVPKIQENIIKQIKGGSEGLDAFQTNFYATKNQFAEDAMTCFSDHLRPVGQCPDYKSDKKLLKPDTDAERKEAGLEKAGKKGPKIYLCDFCPVKSFNMKKHNEEKGLYK